jgi:NADH:ubiquinone oxidoreductase subunit C
VSIEEFSSRLKARFPASAAVDKPEAQVKPYPTFELPASDLSQLVRWLRDEEGYTYLDMVTAVDWKGPTSAAGYIEEPNPNPYLPKGAFGAEKMEPKANPKVEYKEVFRVVYLLTNLERRQKIALKVEVPRSEPVVPSLVALFKTADWHEREAFDLLGVRFDGHPNLKKILTPEFVQGHPLRKDYVHQKDHLD